MFFNEVPSYLSQSNGVDFDQATIVDKARDYHKRPFLGILLAFPGILCETEMQAMNILTFREFIAHSRDLFSRAAIVRYAS